MFECGALQPLEIVMLQLYPPLNDFRKRGKQTIAKVNSLATNVCMYDGTCEAL